MNDIKVMYDENGIEIMTPQEYANLIGLHKVVNSEEELEHAMYETNEETGENMMDLEDHYGNYFTSRSNYPIDEIELIREERFDVVRIENRYYELTVEEE